MADTEDTDMVTEALAMGMEVGDTPHLMVTPLRIPDSRVLDFRAMPWQVLMLKTTLLRNEESKSDKSWRRSVQ